ncbi:hypothetical protein BJ970_004974 [Saccharopolyspora phatthalungensis]|uniref:Uncharacterized protein n=1 Tax=Saccharopolyspora phatthalungensis TaxID=664693 RepID=A0A840QCD2_9PSEU|nr:hypothetical protein [Saccharopolyspora phatthalungensis]
MPYGSAAAGVFVQWRPLVVGRGRVGKELPGVPGARVDQVRVHMVGVAIARCEVVGDEHVINRHPQRVGDGARRATARSPLWSFVVAMV